MDVKKIFSFLHDIKNNNDRQWFISNKDYYIAAKNEFEQCVNAAIVRIADFDATIKHITVKDATYRFYRDTRFSSDKSPYKRHFGAYIAAHGKKALHGGYYIHLEPGKCMLACGNYYLPTNILTSCRNEIMANIDEWKRVVENDSFVNMFGKPAAGDHSKGFGLEHLKTVPSGFPRDFEYIQYLRMKDYCCWRNVEDSFFEDNNWLDNMSDVFRVAKPMMDFINSVIDDYE